jgi:hypothetical protein
MSPEAQQMMIDTAWALTPGTAAIDCILDGCSAYGVAAAGADFMPFGKVLNRAGDLISWSSRSVGKADGLLARGATEVTVGNRAEAEELFLRRYQGDGYRNVTGMSPRESKAMFGSKSGTYHWDIGPGAYPHGVNHLQVHTHAGPVIRIYFQ